MPKKRSKKMNPRRIPMPKSAFDREAMLEEATKDDMYRAWLLVLNALVEQGRAEPDEFPALLDDVDDYMASPRFRGDGKDSEIASAEKLMGISSPHPNPRPDSVKSAVELECFRKKVYRIATHIALCVICLGFEAAGRFAEDELRLIFFNVELTLAEIDEGRVSYDGLEEALRGYGVEIERRDDDGLGISVGLG